jgi:hypothetical protein
MKNTIPQENTQASTVNNSPEKLLALLTQIQSVFNESLTKDEIFTLVRTVVDTMNQRIIKIGDDVKENKSDMKEETTRLGKEVAEFEKRLREHIEKKSLKLSSDLEQRLTELSGMIGYVESCIEKYDDTEMKEHMDKTGKKMEEIESKIPDAFDPTEIIEDIKELEKKMEELDTKIVTSNRGVGGVTNLRIQQAFKYILKTEEPVGLIDGINTTYTLSQPIFAILSMSLNGETIAQLPNYTISGKTFTFSTVLPSAYSGKDFECKYI